MYVVLYDVVVKKFTFAISCPDAFLSSLTCSWREIFTGRCVLLATNGQCRGTEGNSKTL